MRALALLALTATAVVAQAQPVFDRLTRADGLPSDYVLAVYADGWGFVWFGTDAGAVRWDGRRARVTSVDDGLPHPYVKGFAEGADGTLWVGTNGGLARWTGAAWDPVPTPIGQESTAHLVADPEGRVVTTNQQGLIRREGGRWRVWLAPNEIGMADAPLVFLDGGRILVTGRFGRPEAILLTPVGDGFRAEALVIEGGDVAEPDQRLALFPHADGIVALRQGSRSLVGTARIEPDRGRVVVERVRSSSMERLLLGSARSFAFGRRGLWDVDGWPPVVGARLLEGHVTAAAFDREGGLWVGTFGEGAARLRGTHLTSLRATPATRVALLGDRAWVTGRGPLVAVDLRAAAPRAQSVPLPGTRAVAATPEGAVRLSQGPDLWEAVRPGALARAREGPEGLVVDGRRLRQDATEDGWISGVVETADSLWLGSFGRGVLRFRKEGRNLVGIDTLGVGDGLPTATVEGVVRTRAGVWAITRSGLARLRGGRARPLGRTEGLPSSAVFSLFEAADGTHWAGTDRGVARLDLGAWRAEAIGAEAMAGPGVVALFERPAVPGAVWAVTTGALWRIERVGGGWQARRIDGFPIVRGARQTVEDAAYHAASDRLVLATSEGAVVVDLADLPDGPPLPPPAAIVGASVGGRAVALEGTPEAARLPDLGPGPHEVAVEIAALRFGGDARLEWRRPGGAWRTVAGGRLVLPEVGAGAHRVEVRAVTPGGVASARPARLAFRVAPRWWERRPVQAALLALTLAGLVALVRYASQRRLRAQVAALEADRRVRAERERIRRDLHDHVGAEVAAILTEAEIGRLEAAADGRDATALREVEARARRTMGSLREAIWALGEGALTPATLADRLGRFAREHGRHAGVSVEARALGEADRPLEPARALALYRIGQEAVRNALRHSGAGRLTITVGVREGRAVVEVRDDGVFRLPPGGDGAVPREGGLGLETMRARAEGLGGTFALATDDGTTVRAEVPLVT